MTEQEWLACDDPSRMLKFLESKISDRKLRLFAVACCQRIWHFIVLDVSRKAVDVGERFADGLATIEERRQAKSEAEEVWACLNDTFWSNPRDPANEFDAVVSKANVHLNSIAAAAAAATATVGDRAGEASVMNAPIYASEAMSWARLPCESEYEDAQANAVERGHQVALLRHVVGNPFRLFPQSAWLPATVVQLAAALYNGQNCAFALHDALLDAGHADLAQHFRAEQEHPKGCWALDLVLGKQ